MIQAQFMYDFAGRAPFNEPSGRDALGWDAFYRCYAASDGWFFLAAPTERARCLARVDDLGDLSDGPDADLVHALHIRFKKRPIAFWADRLSTGASAVVPLASMLETRDAHLHHEGPEQIGMPRESFCAVRHLDHPMGRWCDLAAPVAIRPTHASIAVPGPAPKYGADTTDVLAGLGFTSEEIDAMLSTGAAALSWSARYLPE